MARKSRRFRHRRGVKKTKRRTRSLKRKTLRRKSKKTKRKTRKKRGGKKVNMFRLNMDIDGDLDHAKKKTVTLDDLAKLNLGNNQKEFDDAPWCLRIFFNLAIFSTSLAATFFLTIFSAISDAFGIPIKGLA